MHKIGLRQYKLWPTLSFVLLIANLAYFSNNFIGWIITLVFFLFIPGYLLLSCLMHNIKSRWEIVSFSLGLSILLLILGGLALNTLHAFGLQRPLTTSNIFITIDVVTLILLLLNKNRALSLHHRLPRPSKEQGAMFAVLTLLPFLAIGGAIRLNNGGSNIITMILFGLVAILFVILIWRKRLQPLYPYAVIMMGLSVLFTVSLRGWHITGSDIQREFYVFQLTSKADYWSIATFRNTYNACLSITILPTILAKITTISAPYIYKVVFQIIFAFGLLPIYFLMKHLRNARTGLIGAFIFIAFPTFLNDMPFLNRQEIAFIFFSLLIFTAFLDINRKAKNILTIGALIGLILSHYSSSYITLGLLILAWMFYKLLASKQHKSERDLFKLSLLSLPIILAALLFTFLWNAQITSTTTGLKDTLAQSLNGLIDHSAAQSSDVSYSLFAPSTKSPPELLSNYEGNNASEVQYVAQPTLPLTKTGKLTSHIVDVGTINGVIRTFSAKIMQVLLLVGVVSLFLRRHKMTAKGSLYFLALSLGCVVLLTLQTLLPQASVDYGTLRFFQQALIILGIPIVIGAESLLFFLPRLRMHIMVVFFAFLFLDLSGFIPQILGGYQAQLSLNNSGDYYSQYYVNSSDIHGENWLIKNTSAKSLIAADDYSSLHFLAQENSSRNFIRPTSSIPQSAYLFNDYTNTKSGVYTIGLNGTHVGYILTKPAGSYKNLIYSNSGSELYK